MKVHSSTRGFTLIELLVVISVIGMLASVILVSLQSARQKGVQGAALTFATTNYHAFGADASLLLDFNDQTVNDRAGNFQWSITKNGGSYDQSTPSGSGYSFNTTGLNDIVISLPTGVSQGPAFGRHTFSLWVKIQTSAGPPYVITGLSHNGSCGANCINFKALPGSNLLVVGPNSCLISDNSISLPTGQWFHIAYSMNGSTATIYYNGNPVPGYTNVTCASAISDYLDGVNIGRASFNGNIDDLAIYNSPLSAAEIHNIYAEGLRTHQFASR